MTKTKKKPHDLRDDMWAPRTSITDTDERLAGDEPPAVNPQTGDLPLVTPTPGKGVPEGSTVKG